MARPGSYACREPISVAMGMDYSVGSGLGVTPALGGLAQAGMGQVIQAGKKCSSKEIGVLPAGGGMDTEQAKEQA